MPDNVESQRLGNRRETPYASRARYYTVNEAFSIKQPPVPRHVFVAERDRAFDAATGTALIPLDLSAAIGAPAPASTPLILAAYLRLKTGRPFSARLPATAETYYVISGAGRSRNGAAEIAWQPGDVFVFPGGGETVHAAGLEDAVLYCLTDQPALAFAHAAPVGAEAAAVEAVHYPAEEIAAAVERTHLLTSDTDPGKATLLSSARMQARRTLTPTFTLALNTLEPGKTQRPHRHNAVALTLPIDCQGCYSLIEGERVDWQPYAVMVTPPAEEHTHINAGSKLMTSLVVQDGGLHYYTRTMGFAFTDM